MQNFTFLHTCLLQLLIIGVSFSQSTPSTPSKKLWHNKERVMHYQPDGEDFVISTGKSRFNRALYGSNTSFRVEAGDLPEFALYMPGMGGNLRFGLISGTSSKWLIDAASIKARYRPGSMLYEIQDPMLGEGTLYLTVLALNDAEGLIVKAESKNIGSNINLFWAFGGASGKKFSRDGDIGADPESSFYLHPEYCKDNNFTLKGNEFALSYGSGKALSEAERYEINHFNQKQNDSLNKPKAQKILKGVFPAQAEIHLGDATKQDSPLNFFNSKSSDTPAVTARLLLKSGDLSYFLIYNPDSKHSFTYADASLVFNKAEEARKKLAVRVKINTPDPYINTLGGALGVAADAIWENPTYLHGAVAWRMRLNGWRGAYTGDPLGWHDRSKAHFASYALSQVTSPESGPVVPDTALHLARQLEKMGTSMFSSGYICRNPNGDFRAHHYDMNLVFIDELLNHFYWTGDLAFVKEIWPVLKRHLAWEKRNYDMDGDGLYDAYCAIWASDALQYSGGGVTHSSAYNYKANKMAADLAKILGEDPAPYHNEATRILNAINTNLWISGLGRYAEYKDLLGLKKTHPAAALWTIYHTLDSEVADPFQAYQTLRYIDTEIPHIPIIAKGLPEGNLYTVSTSNWMPYTWSINNVALAEVLHTSLAYWQGGRSQEAYKMWKSSIIESMYLSASPGGFEQLSFYDAIRGELYRDFADPIGIVSRTLVEGLFGVHPNSLENTVIIKPGLPQEWSFASLKVPNILFDFKRNGGTDNYTIVPQFTKPLTLKLQIKARGELIKSVTVNGKAAAWVNIDEAIETPEIEVNCGLAEKYDIEISWQGQTPEVATIDSSYVGGEVLTSRFNKAGILEVLDPQHALEKPEIESNILKAKVKSGNGHKTVFVKVKGKTFTWWSPLNFEVKDPLEIVSSDEQDKASLKFRVRNNSAADIRGKLIVNKGKDAFTKELKIEQGKVSEEFIIPDNQLITGSNVVRVETNDGKFIEQTLINWDIQSSEEVRWEKVNLSKFFNDQVTNIFKNKYLTPRPPYPTLQLPVQGVGNWCYPLVDPKIEDTGLRNLAGDKNEIRLPQGIPFTTPGNEKGKNIVFASQWDNYPDEVSIPLKGKASHIYLLMAGTTNPMQSRFVNGQVLIEYKDGSKDSLDLKNPDTWWPIEQDYFSDGFAFSLSSPKPIRIHLKTGLTTRDFSTYTTLKGYSNRVIDGGAATVLDLPLNASKDLKSLKVKAIANDVVIGLMSATLVR